MQRIRPTRARGFTLLELLVVLILVGTVVSMAALSVGDGGRGARIKQEARRLQALLQLAADEAVLLNRTIAVEIDSDRYQFSRYHVKERRCQGLDDKLFRQRTLPEGVEMELILGDLALPLDENANAVDRLMNQAGAVEQMMNRDGAVEELMEDPLLEEFGEQCRPQLTLYSSGERTPFSLSSVLMRGRVIPDTSCAAGCSAPSPSRGRWSRCRDHPLS